MSQLDDIKKRLEERKAKMTERYNSPEAVKLRGSIEKSNERILKSSAKRSALAKKQTERAHKKESNRVFKEGSVAWPKTDEQKREHQRRFKKAWNK